MKAQICDLCGKPKAHRRLVLRSFGRGRDRLLVDRIPQISCSACGGSYFTAATLKAIERLRARRRKSTKRRLVAVASFVSVR
jgi:YgiT-type zinc finger domain-containing protein